MLKMHNNQITKIKDQKLAKTEEKVNNWLDNIKQKPTSRNEVNCIIVEAEKATMLTETDYALFTWICVEQPMQTEEFLQRSDIQALLNNPKINAAGKLTRMEHLAKHPLTDQ